MTERSVEIDLEASPDRVWSLVGDFEGVGQWFPGIDSTRIEGDVRVLGMGGIEVRERLLERDEQRRSLTYAIVDGVPVDRHRATVAVTPRDGGSHLTWSFDVEPESMLQMMQDVYRQAVDEVAKRTA